MRACELLSKACLEGCVNEPGYICTGLLSAQRLHTSLKTMATSIRHCLWVNIFMSGQQIQHTQITTEDIFSVLWKTEQNNTNTSIWGGNCIPQTISPQFPFRTFVTFFVFCSPLPSVHCAVCCHSPDTVWSPLLQHRVRGNSCCLLEGNSWSHSVCCWSPICWIVGRP